MSYSEVGVDRKKEEKTVERILELIKKTQNEYQNIPEGHFAGGIEYKDDVISMATDGVGTKVLLAQEFSRFKEIGVDCVAMNVNDLIATGSIPVAFVDYIAVEKQDTKLIESLVKGLVEGCIQSEIPLIGGETAVMTEVIKGMNNGFDIAGTALGIQSKNRIVTGNQIREGDCIIGIESSGIHSNGLTLARKLILDKNLRKKLLTPTRIYVKAIKALLSSTFKIKGMAHITGGGFTNLLRLGEWHYALNAWKIPEIFQVMAEEIDEKEMYRTFNMGIGYVVIVAENEAEDTIQMLNEYYQTQRIGIVQKGNDVTIDGLSLVSL